MRSAASCANSDAHSLQLVELRQRSLAAVEDPQGLVVERRQHLDVLGFQGRRDAALHECDVHAGIRVAQQAQVVGRAARHSFLDDDALARECLFVALRVLVVGTKLGAGREHDVARRRGLQETRGNPQRHCN